MFKLKEYNTDAKTEILAGITTFLTMIYIVIVNPVILSSAGVPFDQVFTATIISAVVATLWMALAANYPIAIAPGMGMNAYFAALVVGSNGSIDYATAFSAVFVAGIIFIILSLTSFREKLIEAIPNNLKHAISAGIGLFIAFIGLRSAGIIVANKSNLIGLGDLQSEKVVLTLIGLAITIILYTLNVNGALFFGMIITGLIAFFRGQLSFDKGLFASPHLPDGLMISNPFAAFGDVIHHNLYTVVFSFLLVTIFDTTGTMVGVAQQAGLMKGNKMPRVRQALLADSFGTTIGALFGTSPTTAYVESSSGVAAITSPALIIVGSLMMGAVAKINWNDFDEAFPAFLVVLAMPLTSSIATGIALGFISYPLMKLVKGKGKQVHPLVYVFAVLFLYQLIFLPH
jgi:AGZA family xanthine/uracil permease-like MFS transporter